MSWKSKRLYVNIKSCPIKDDTILISISVTTGVDHQAEDDCWLPILAIPSDNMKIPGYSEAVREASLLIATAVVKDYARHMGGEVSNMEVVDRMTPGNN